MRFYNPNQLNVATLVVVLAIIAMLGGIGLASRGFLITPNAIYAGESGYAVALTAADTYRHLCVGTATAAPVLPASCKTTLATIQADVKITDAAYQQIKGYETNPPAGAAASFLAALSVLKAAIPTV